MKRFVFKEVFPEESVVARWVLTLGIIFNETITVHRHVLSDKSNESEMSKSEWLYFFRLSCAHAREACKTICEGMKDASIAAFIEQIPEEGKEAVATIVAVTEPWEGSFIKTIVKPIRDDVFHYDYGKEMAEVLRKLYLVEPTFEGKLELADTHAQTRLFFADDFEANVLGDIISHQRVTIEEVLQELMKLQMAIIKACRVITTTYLLFHKQKLSE